MTGLPNFTNLVAQTMDQRTSMQQANAQTREDLASALRAAHDARASWRAESPDEEIAGNVTKRLNVWCGDTFRLHLIVHDSGRVLFPKEEANDAFTAKNCAEALHEIARRFALHRMPDEAVVVRRSVQTR